MKQKLSLICILIIISLSTNAQRLGVKAGLSLAKANYEYTGTSISTSNLVGFQGGLIGEIPISEDLFLNSGVLFIQKGTKLSLMGLDVKFPINSIEIPLNLAYKYDMGGLKLFGQIGPYLGVGLSAKMEGGGEVETIDFGTEIDQMKRIDIGANFGGGIEINKVQLGISYGLGLTNLSNDPDESLKNGALSISLGVMFGE